MTGDEKLKQANPDWVAGCFNPIVNTTTNEDPVNHPSHYTNTSIECIDAMIETQGAEAVKQFCICNAFKYLWRHNSKNGDEDLRKAEWYLHKANSL